MLLNNSNPKLLRYYFDTDIACNKDHLQINS